MAESGEAPLTLFTKFDALPRKHYGCIVSDPPWHHKSYSIKGQGRSPSRHYRTLTLEEICAFPVADVAARDCHLMLWTTQPHLEQSFAVLRSWGFRYSSCFMFWVKLNPHSGDAIWITERDLHRGMGFTTRKNVEIVLLGRRGSPKRLNKHTLDVLFAARRQHSRKPDDFYTAVEGYAAGPRLDMFSRQEREGWDNFGDEAGKFGPLQRETKANAAVPPPALPPGGLEVAMGRPKFVMSPAPDMPGDLGTNVVPFFRGNRA